MGQSVPSRTILRGSVDVKRPTAAPELAWRPKVTSLEMLGRGQGSTDECGFEGVHAGAVSSDCSAGHSTWFIVLNAHAKRGQCPTTISRPCGGPFPVVSPPWGLRDEMKANPLTDRMAFV